ncbi:hypothetical protein I79_013901 [Cricetulus griseus]|uniref:Uncharacterized protein n=1 Tax=Cricetulus griseus TaxID=10029 RepID=G3HSQ7_CRIGR|nr:hypothetical protein I79_013901 [Cricetulus griseus]
MGRACAPCKSTSKSGKHSSWSGQCAQHWPSSGDPKHPAAASDGPSSFYSNNIET